MAWPKDNTKPLPPVRSKLQASVDKGVGGAVAGTIGRLATMPPQAMTALAQHAPVTQVVGGAVNRLTADARSRTANANANTARLIGDSRAGLLANQPMPNFAAPPTQLPARQREVRGALQPDGSRLVIDQRPIAQATPMNAPAPQAAAPVHTVYEQDHSGNIVPVQRLTAGRSQAPTPQPQNRLSGIQRVGNMDVTFATDTPLSARQAFMTNPVKPEGQIAQYNRNALAEADRQEFNRSKQQTQGPEMLTRENSTMGWKSRLALNNQMLQNEADLEKTRLSGSQNMAVEAVRGQNQLANTRLSGTVDMRGQDLQAEAAQERNRIDKASVESQDRERQSQMEARDLEIQEQLRIKSLQDQLVTPELSDEKRKQVENQLYAIMGKPQQKYQTATRTYTDAQGNVVNEPYLIDAEGNATPIGGEGQQAPTVEAPAAAVEYLNKNPQEAASFKRKYGYLPPGFTL